MEKIIVRYFVRGIHCAQIITGFHELKRRSGIRVQFEDHTCDDVYPYKTAIVEAVFKNHLIVYDMLDGYNEPKAIQWFYNRCDLYFKRSFSEYENACMGLDTGKIYPLGFNYHVSYLGNPCEGRFVDQMKEAIKLFVGKETNSLFNRRAFEVLPVYRTKEEIKVLFLARLWSNDSSLPPELNEERERINTMRIDIIETLRRELPENFIGGLSNSSIAIKLAPHLCVSDDISSRKNYLNTMHSCDICIGTTGLHKSIGWKTAEYIAASKGLVLEYPYYQVPGHFEENKNYLAFTSADHCLESVLFLMNHPDELYSMRKENHEYYLNYLAPSALALNSIMTVESILS